MSYEENKERYYRSNLFPIDETVENYLKKYDEQQAENERLAKAAELQAKLNAKRNPQQHAGNPGTGSNDANDKPEEPKVKPTVAQTKNYVLEHDVKLWQAMQNVQDNGKRIITVPELIQIKNNDLNHELWSKWCHGNTEVIIGKWRKSGLPFTEEKYLLIVHGPGVFSNNPQSIKKAIADGLVNNWGKVALKTFKDLLGGKRPDNSAIEVIPYNELANHAKNADDFYAIRYDTQQIKEIMAKSSGRHEFNEMKKNILCIGLAGYANCDILTDKNGNKNLVLNDYINNVHKKFNQDDFGMHHALENADLSQAESLGRLGYVDSVNDGFYCDNFDYVGRFLGV